MNSSTKSTIDDMVFEHRNRAYGSYRLRKQYPLRLAIGFLVSLSVIVLLVLSYAWYLNSAGDETVFLYSSANPYLKSTQGSLLSSQELDSYRNKAPYQDDLNENTKSPVDELHNFAVTETVMPDTFKPPKDNESQSPLPEGLKSSDDSVFFGGFLPGDGEGGGAGGEIDRFPVFPGGPVHKYIESILNYPVQAVKQKIHGAVLLSFVVNKTGEVVDIKVEKGVHPLLDNEAMKAVKSLPRWQPGLRHGRPIAIQLIIRINFIPLN
jgi:protein TonB